MFHRFFQTSWESKPLIYEANKWPKENQMRPTITSTDQSSLKGSHWIPYVDFLLLPAKASISLFLSVQMDFYIYPEQVLDCLWRGSSLVPMFHLVWRSFCLDFTSVFVVKNVNYNLLKWWNVTASMIPFFCSPFDIISLQIVTWWSSSECEIFK